VTFGALPAWQAWMLIAGAAAIALALFWIKVRPPRWEVPSLLVWRRVFANRRELTWWERVRRAISCAITVLVAAALAFALARPVPPGGSSTNRLLLVLDSSWSMGALTADGTSRWARAVREAASLARATTGDVIVATTAAGVIMGPTADDEAVEQVLTALAPTGVGDGRWPAATATIVHFFTDGAVARTLDDSVLVHSVHEPAPNVAVTAFEARAAISASTPAVAYLEVANFSTTPQEVRLTLTRDATLIVDRRLPMGAGEILREALPLAPSGGPRLRAHVSAPGNALAIDDEGVAWITPADPVDVLLVSDSPTALAGLLERDPVVRVRSIPTASYRAGGGVDVVVFDHWLPATPPIQPMLTIAPPSTPWLAAKGAVENATMWTVSRPHEIVAGVDAVMLGMTRIQRYDVPALAVVARTANGAPVIAVEDKPDRRLVLFAFDPDPTMGGAPAFPVLVSNAVDWLARPYRGAARQPGRIALDASTSRIVSPEGRALPLMRAADRVDAVLPTPGLYLVRAGGSQSVVPVNAGSLATSNLLRAPRDSGGTRIEGSLPTRPWWIYGVVLAFVVAVVEWWTWQRRITV
jgi:hypothetical protein